MFYLNKNSLPILISVAVFALSYYVPEPYLQPLRAAGLFAFSGAITNWIAVYMLFEKVPFIYGSGVIPSRFESLKLALFDLVKNNLFKAETVNKVFQRDEKEGGFQINVEPIMDSIPFDNAYEQLKEAIMQSSFGSVLNMVGGESVLEPLREKVTEKLKVFIRETVDSEKFKQALNQGLDDIAGSDSFMAKIELVVKERLDELTPEMVNDLMKDMIKQHLGWLVVWGAIFGGIIGIVSVYLP